VASLDPYHPEFGTACRSVISVANAKMQVDAAAGVTGASDDPELSSRPNDFTLLNKWCISEVKIPCGVARCRVTIIGCVMHQHDMVAVRPCRLCRGDQDSASRSGKDRDGRFEPALPRERSKIE